ncbi:AP2-associated protein kinase 1-like [Impatiens glandulifera]|uniref:AP2-associated protein kinase 1-like n=1 Tax=Impatiens glandulifera TaxID=253017 RepID=UPI001FB067A9|nr:AP2-associated protein kinase 1-like [Impatiens glandulifera]
MWRFKQLMPKDQTGLEGRTIDIGNLKVHVRNAIAEGGFSCVYLAREALHGSKQYALKHIICIDEESLELVKKEISTMKSLKGHPNIVPLFAHAIFDMGRTKEALLVMEYCEKSLVNVLENRGAGYFDEKQILVIFRDICNSVFAMHCQSPPIAHRDLKAENLLLGHDGLWKLCDFGSISTNHKRFEKAEEMGIEEDNIRKYTTPAYRAPEMWDLFRREVINEKVDIWALGCLLFRICYLKLAFDGESKLQILNGNYRIPDSPKYSTNITSLIKDMLQSSPDARPDITQVWFRVNNLLPEELQKSLPDRPSESSLPAPDILEGIQKTKHKNQPMPMPQPSGGNAGHLGAFWTTEHAKDVNVVKFVEEPIFPKWDAFPQNIVPHREENIQPRPNLKNVQGEPNRRSKSSSFGNEAFNCFVAEFDMDKLNSQVIVKKSGNEEEKEKEMKMDSEVEKLKKQLKQANVEKDEIMSKFEKLSAICRSQRQELHELKQELATRKKVDVTPQLKQELATRTKVDGTPQQREMVWEFQPGLFENSSPNPEPKDLFDETNQNKKIEGTIWELQQGLFENNSPNPDPNSGWGFGAESFPTFSGGGGDSKNTNSSFSASQPAGWAGF